MDPNSPLARKERARGTSRSELVLGIVATDSTFAPTFASAVDIERGPCCETGWCGKCIHCNTKLYVGLRGQTDATVEHIRPLCDGGDPTDPRNLALACAGCNNEKGIRHDGHAGRGGRADEVIAQLQAKRQSRWREPVQRTWPAG